MKVQQSSPYSQILVLLQAIDSFYMNHKAPVKTLSHIISNNSHNNNNSSSITISVSII